MSDQSLSKTLDRLHRLQGGEQFEPDAEPSPKEAADLRAKLEDDAYAAADREPERKAAAKRLSTARQVLKNAVGQMRHGHIVDADAREKLVDEAVSMLGGNISAAQRRAIADAVNTSADAIREGDRSTGQRAAEAAAEAVAGDAGKIDETFPETDDPATLAAQIERM